MDGNGLSHGSVLLVDDEPTITEVLSHYLERAGYDTRVAADGHVALELARHRRPDAIVEAHGGRIWLAESATGTRVRFSLPRAS